MQSCKGQENCEVLKNGVSILLSKKPLGCSNLTWIVLISVLALFKPSPFPFHRTRKRTCVIAWPLGARSCIFSHQWRTAWFCFKEFNFKGFSDSQTVFFIGSGLVRNITWVIRIALPKFGCFYFGKFNQKYYTLR